MDLLWEYGPLTVAEMVQHYDEPRPHFNTVSTMVRSLEKKGLGGVIRDYLDNSYKKAVSQFVEDERISLEELKDLVRMIEKDRRRK